MAENERTILEPAQLAGNELLLQQRDLAAAQMALRQFTNALAFNMWVLVEVGAVTPAEFQTLKSTLNDAARVVDSRMTKLDAELTKRLPTPYDRPTDNS